MNSLRTEFLLILRRNSVNALSNSSQILAVQNMEISVSVKVSISSSVQEMSDPAETEYGFERAEEESGVTPRRPESVEQEVVESGVTPRRPESVELEVVESGVTPPKT